MDALAVGLIVGLAAWMLLSIRRKSARYRRLAQRGVPVQAEVTRRFVRRRPKSPGVAYIEYRFETLSGEQVAQTAVVSLAEYERTQPGDQIAVIYDPDAPAFSRPQTFLERKGYLHSG